MFVIINNVGIMINPDVNAKNLLIKECVIKDLLEILVIVNVSVMYHDVNVSWDVKKYLDYKNCKCRRRLIDKLVEEYNENIDGNKMICNSTSNDYGKICNFCAVYIALWAIPFITSISISNIFIYFHWYLEIRYTNITNINVNTETVIYWKYKW